MAFSRYVPVWSGFPGAPGYTVLHFPGAGGGEDVAQAAARVRTFFETIKNLIPGDAIITYPGEMTNHADDGTLTGATAVSPLPAPTDCTGLGAYAAPVGCRVTWETGLVVGGRRLRGRTFLVPLTTACYDSVGTINATQLTTIQDAANAMLAGLVTDGVPLGVWSPTTSTVGTVTSASVPDQVTVLRSRRD